MNKQAHWLWDESKKWCDQGLISQEQAIQIRGLYPEPKTALPWSTIVLSSLGAAVAGLGIILLLAYNWQDISRGSKLGIILAGVAGLHYFGSSLFQRDDWRRQAGEALCVAGTMLFGAGIWLVAQIYHIEEHYPNGFLFWGLGALALAWAMPSVPQAILSIVLLCIWGSSEAWGFREGVDWAPVAVLAVMVLLARRTRSPLLLFFALAGFVISMCANTSAISGELVVRVMLNFGAFFLAVAFLMRRSDSWFPNSARAWEFFGWLTFLFCLYLLTFPGMISHLLWSYRTEADHKWLYDLYAWGPFVLALGGWAAVAWRARSPEFRNVESHRLNVEYCLIPLAAVICQFFAESSMSDEKWLTAGIFNLVFLTLAVAWMARGCRKALLQPTLLGSLFFVALIATRYFDLFESLAVRGLIFVVMGGLLFGEGLLFHRARRRPQSTEGNG